MQKSPMAIAEVVVIASRRHHSVPATKARYGDSDASFLGLIIRITKLIGLLGENIELKFIERLEDLGQVAALNDSSNVFWPPLDVMAKKKYLYYDFIRFLCENKNTGVDASPSGVWLARAGKIPTLDCTSARGKITVAMNLRSFERYGADRNGSMATWLVVIDQLLDLDCSITMIGGESLVSKEALKAENRIAWSVDYDVDPLLDLAVIASSDIMIGSGSGFSIYPTFLKNGKGISTGFDLAKFQPRHGADLVVTREYSYLNAGPGQARLLENHDPVKIMENFFDFLKITPSEKSNHNINDRSTLPTLISNT